MRCIFCCIRWYSKLVYAQVSSEKKVSVSNLPWVWIGAETHSGDILSLTNVVNPAVEYGDRVTVQFLQLLTGVAHAKRWFYLDSKTFKEEEIPAEGVIIEDDSDE